MSATSKIFARLREPQLRERLPFHQLHRNRRTTGILHKIVDAHDVRMSELARPPCLGLEIVKRRRVPAHRVGQKLQSHVLSERFVPRAPDNTHAASPEHGLQRVASEDALSRGRTAHRGFGIRAGGAHLGAT
jgi:hypothetical protein